MHFHFRASIKPIFENHVFRGVLELFYPLKRPKTRNSKENAPKIFFFAEMGCIYTGPNYIKRQSDSDNFLTFWYTLLCTFKQKFARTLCTFKQKLVHTMYVRACCHEATFSKTLAGVFFWCLFMYRNGTKNLKNLGRRFHEWKLVWSFGLIYSVKRVKNSEKNAIFQNWPKTHPKMLYA